MPISGRPIQFPDGGACLGVREFIECQQATGCDDVISYACEGLDAPLYQFPDSCTPMDWSECGPPPPIDLQPCG